MYEEMVSEINRPQVLLRLVFTIVFFFVLEIIVILVQLVTAFQYISLLITKKHIESLRSFSAKIAVYVYRIMRYICLNDNDKPFPFNEFPQSEEDPEKNVIF